MNTACQAVNTCIGANPTACQTAMTEQALRTCLMMTCPDATAGIDAFLDSQVCLATSCAAECS
jgi:hypothetical protein